MDNRFEVRWYQLHFGEVKMDGPFVGRFRPDCTVIAMGSSRAIGPVIDRPNRTGGDSIRRPCYRSAPGQGSRRFTPWYERLVSGTTLAVAGPKAGL